MEHARHWLPEAGCLGEWLGGGARCCPDFPRPQALRKGTASGAWSRLWVVAYRFLTSKSPGEERGFGVHSLALGGAGRGQAPASESSLSWLWRRGRLEQQKWVAGSAGAGPPPRVQDFRPTGRLRVPQTFVHSYVHRCCNSPLCTRHHARQWVGGHLTSALQDLWSSQGMRVGFEAGKP